jgi:DNA-binding response OmpR family regulator
VLARGDSATVEDIDVLVVGAEWPTRALLRAQLLEDGFNTLAADAWPPPREFLAGVTRPRLVVVDLRGLTDPQTVVREARLWVGAEHVLVIASMATLSPDVLRQSGVHVIERPASIRHIVSRARSILSRQL